MGDGDANTPSSSETLWDPNHDETLLEAVDELEASGVPALTSVQPPIQPDASEFFSGAQARTDSGSRQAKTEDSSVGVVSTLGQAAPLVAAGEGAADVEIAGGDPSSALRGASVEADEAVAPAAPKTVAKAASLKTAADAAAPPSGADFGAFLSRYIGVAFAQQLAFEQFLGAATWHLNLDVGTVTFGELGTFPIQLLGSVSDSEDSWMWAWANRSGGILPAAISHVHELRTTVPLSEFQKSVVSLSGASGHELALMISGLAGGVPYFCGPFPGGAVYFLVMGLPFGERPRPKSLPELVPAILSAFPRVDARLVVEGLINDSGMASTDDGSVLTARAATGEVEFEFDGEVMVRSEYRPRADGTSAPMATAEVQDRVAFEASESAPRAAMPLLRPDVDAGGLGAGPPTSDAEDAEQAALDGVEREVALLTGSGGALTTEGPAAPSVHSETLEEDLDFSGVSDLVDEVEVFEEHDPSPVPERVKRPVLPSTSQQTDEFAFPEPVRAETSNAQVIASVQALTASGEARRAAESTERSGSGAHARTELSGSSDGYGAMGPDDLVNSDGFGAMPPKDPESEYSSMFRDEIVMDAHGADSGAEMQISGAYDWADDSERTEGLGGDTYGGVNSNTSAVDFMFGGDNFSPGEVDEPDKSDAFVAARDSVSWSGAPQNVPSGSRPRHAPITIETSGDSTDLRELIESGMPGGSSASPIGLGTASEAPTSYSGRAITLAPEDGSSAAEDSAAEIASARSLGAAGAEAHAETASASSSSLGEQSAINGPFADRAAPGKPVARATIGGLQLATGIHAGIVSQSSGAIGGLPVFAADANAASVADSRAAPLEQSFPALVAGGTPIQSGLRPVPSGSETLSSSGIGRALGRATHEVSGAASDEVTLGRSVDVSQVWNQSVKATGGLSPELELQHTRPVSDAKSVPSLLPQLVPTASVDEKSERDLGQFYSMGISAAVVVLVLVFVVSVAGGGASAEFEAVHLFHEDGHDAALSYTFVLEDLPESPDGLVVRLESAAFASPVVIPWNIVSDQPAAEATLYTNQTSIDSVLIDEVVRQDAVVRISVELDGHSVGSERLDIRELYSFD